MKATESRARAAAKKGEAADGNVDLHSLLLLFAHV